MHRRWVLVCAILLLGPAVLASGPRRKAAPADTAAPPAPRNPVIRTITFTDATLRNPPVVHVVGGWPTIIELPVALNPTSPWLLPEGGKTFEGKFAPQHYGNNIILRPARDIASPTVLAINLKNGQVLVFLLQTAEGVVDAKINVDLRLDPSLVPDSPASLQLLVARLQSERDACLSAPPYQALARMILENAGGEQPPLQIYGGRRKEFRQNRMLVELLYVYHLLGRSYAVFSVENRDNAKEWVFDRADLWIDNALKSGPLVVSSMNKVSVQPDGAPGYIVVGFKPAKTEGQEHAKVVLRERNGSRQVEMDDLDL